MKYEIDDFETKISEEELEQMRIRTPAVAGMFYPKEKSKLEDSINQSIANKFGVGKIKQNNERVFEIGRAHV